MPKRPPIHHPAHAKTAAAARTDYDRQRGGSTARGYTARWQRASRQHLAEHPLCVVCAKAGRVVSATEVDHIVPHQGDRALFWDRSNWQALCKPCHSRKTATETGFGRPAGP